MNINKLSSVKRNSKEHSYQKELKVIMEPLFFSLIVKKKYDNKLFFFIFLFFGVKDHPRSPNWTLDFEPAFSQQFYFPLSPRSLFPTRQRFPIPNHVTSGCMSLRSLFPTGQRFPIPNHVTSGCMSPQSLFSHWSAVSPY